MATRSMSWSNRLEEASEEEKHVFLKSVLLAILSPNRNLCWSFFADCKAMCLRSLSALRIMDGEMSMSMRNRKSALINVRRAFQTKSGTVALPIPKPYKTSH